MILKSHSINKKNNFISGWYIDKNLCNELINFFEKSPDKDKTPGRLGADLRVVKEQKDSLDLYLDSSDTQYPLNEYLSSLSNVIDHYKKQYSYCDRDMEVWGLTASYNLQRYLPSQGYRMWHCEKSGHKESLHRHLVFMTYLNDLTDGGETEWYYQKEKIKPEKGLTIIWPAEWMFTHRGIVSETQTKYIVTGWYGFR